MMEIVEIKFIDYFGYYSQAMMPCRVGFILPKIVDRNTLFKGHSERCEESHAGMLNSSVPVG